MAALSAASASGTTAGPAARARQVLVVYEEGGISQMDTWDPKPQAPVDHRTPYTPIATSVPGIEFSSLMPMISQQAHRLAVVRSMTTAAAPSYPNGCKEFFKGYRFNAPVDFPDIGAVVSHVMGTDCPQLPGYVFCPGVNMLVCFVTEMGRTPHINKHAGRDHWGRVMSIAFAGAGVPDGRPIDFTDGGAPHNGAVLKS